MQKLGLSLIVFQAYQPRQSGKYLKAWSQNNKKVYQKWAYYFSHTYKGWNDPSRYSRGITVVLKITNISPSGKKYGALMVQLGHHLGKNVPFFYPYFFTDTPESCEVKTVEQVYYMLEIYFTVMHMNNFKFDYVPASFPWVVNFTLRNESFPNTEFDFPVE